MSDASSNSAADAGDASDEESLAGDDTVSPQDQFAAAWDRVEEEGPPRLGDFLPEAMPFRRQVLEELIKIDLERRWGQFGVPKRIEQYVAEFPELQQGGVPASLLFAEFQKRLDADDDVSLLDYVNHYPEHADALKQLCEQQMDSHATVLTDPESQPLDNFVAGDRVGDFDLIMALGQGAFARVFLARQRSMQRLVALKISLDKGIEGQTLAQLDHDYIVRVFHQTSLPDQNIRLLAMQYVPGGTLLSAIRMAAKSPNAPRTGRLLLQSIDQTLERRGDICPSDSSVRERLSQFSWPETTAWIGERLAIGLHEAHQRGVLHRDIKPANVLLTAEGVPKLADFNISHHGRGEESQPTAYFGGSLPYMSPEHLEAFHPGHERSADGLDSRADQYSLGILLWEMLTGERPFQDPERASGQLSALDDMLSLRRAGVSEEALHALPEETPPTLKRVLLKCLAPDRDERWNSAEELASQLRICLDSEARRLVDPPVRSWGPILFRWAVLIVVLITVIPNVISAVGNYLYNEHQIMRRQAPDQRELLFRIQGYVNGIAFPLGIALIAALARQTQRGVLCPLSTADSVSQEAAGRNCLLLGHRCALICLAEWTIAGIAYPIIVDWNNVDMPATSYGHFFFSLLICGLFAAAYPFFGTTWFSVRWLFPVLLRHGDCRGRFRQSLRQLKALLRIYLYMAAAIPLLALLAISFVGADLLWLMRCLSLGGLFAFAAAFGMYRRLEEDIAAMERVCAPRAP